MDVRTNSISQEPLPPELRLPTWEWRGELWLNVISLLLGIIVFVLPELPDQVRFLLGPMLLLAPVLIPALEWLWKVSRITYRRVHYYPILRQRAQWAIDELDQMKRNLFDVAQIISAGHLFEIARAGYYQDGLYIALNRPKYPKLAEGDVLLAVHMDDGRAMGFFEVTEVRDSEYYAVGTSNIDSLWLGHVRHLGEAQIMPYMAAIYLPQGEAK